jgi:CheY-like chemotaxis protein
VGLDVTDRKLAEEELRRREAAESASHAKSEFLARTSHELRTPLSVIIGFAQVLQMDALTPAQAEGVGHILHAGRSLLALIDDVLDLAKIEAGKISLTIGPVDADELIEEELRLVAPLAAENRIQVAFEVPSHGVLVAADRQKLAQVILNFLSNAIKYNRPQGNLTVRCQPVADGTLRVSVTDTGAGIAPDDLPRLFRPFERLRTMAQVEGTGLGLALSKDLIEAMGGTVGAESTPGQGSTFWLELPVAGQRAAGPDLPPAGRTPDPPAGRQFTVLYIEDDLANFTVIERVLSRVPGVTVIPAMQGGMGIDLARHHRPDLILLDRHLPDMDGAQVIERLREYPETASTPVVIITADATNLEPDERLASARAYLTKPIDVRSFLALIDEILSSPAADTPPA